MKPHIKKVNGWWECADSTPYGGKSTTPAGAYKAYEMHKSLIEPVIGEAYKAENKGPN